MVVLYEDDYILVCSKPAGIATQAAKVTEKDMVSEVNDYIKKAGGKNPACLIHRLDKPVAGILLFAKTKEAAGILSDAIKNGRTEKHYYALVEGKIKEESGELQNYILKDNATKKAAIVKEKTDGAKPAKLKYKMLKPDKINALSKVTGIENYGDDVTLLDIELITGRYHQIRAQFANIGHPIVGDTMYGANDTGIKKAIFLIAYRLVFEHPKTGVLIECEIPV